MLSAIAIINANGKILFKRDYTASLNIKNYINIYNQSVKYAHAIKNNTKNSLNYLSSDIDSSKSYDLLAKSLILTDGAQWLSPVINYENMSIVNISDELRILGFVQSNANIVSIISLMEKIPLLCRQFFGSFDQDVIEENFITLNEIIDELIDGGYPQLTEAKVITNFLTTAPDIKRTIVTALKSSVPWRTDNVKYRKNEIFLDVIEKFEASIGVNGEIINMNILGMLKLKSYLSGMPEIKLNLSRIAPAANTYDSLNNNDNVSVSSMQKSIFNSLVEEDALNENFLEDVRFHQCVRLNKFELDKVISFIPPDGEFELMNYKIKKNNIQNLPFAITFSFNANCFTQNSTTIEYVIVLDSLYHKKIAASEVLIIVPAPSTSCNPVFRPTTGTVEYKPEADQFIWCIKYMQGQKNALLVVKIVRQIIGIDNNERWFKKPIEVRFTIPFYTVSGLTVKNLRIFEPSGYHAIPWVRYVTHEANYLVRMH